VLLGLTTGQEIGLLVFAGIFIAFSLAASFFFPRRNPDWPGRRLGSFIAVTVVLFVAMMTAVFVLARESEEEGARAEPPAESATPTNSDESGEGPGAGEGAEQGGTSSGGGTSGSAQGDPTAGKQVFASAGCASCHTLADAGASGNVGPNLDEAKPSHDLVVERVTNGKAPMPAFKDQLSEKQIQDVAAYVVDATGGS
jgi:cytochrome c6